MGCATRWDHSLYACHCCRAAVPSGVCHGSPAWRGMWHGRVHLHTARCGVLHNGGRQRTPLTQPRSEALNRAGRRRRGWRLHTRASAECGRRCLVLHICTYGRAVSECTPSHKQPPAVYSPWSSDSSAALSLGQQQGTPDHPISAEELG